MHIHLKFLFLTYWPNVFLHILYIFSLVILLILSGINIATQVYLIPYPILLTTTSYSTQKFVKFYFLNYYLMLRRGNHDDMTAGYNNQSFNKSCGYDFVYTQHQLRLCWGKKPESSDLDSECFGEHCCPCSSGPWWISSCYWPGQIRLIHWAAACGCPLLERYSEGPRIGVRGCFSHTFHTLLPPPRPRE